MTNPYNRIRIVVADDHNLIIKGLKLLLSDADHIEIVGEAMDGEEALQVVEKEKPDLLVTDISMPKVSGVELIEKITEKNLDTKVLVLSNFFDDQHILEAYEKGSKGYLPKSVDDEHLIYAIGKIAKGEIYYHQSVLDVLGTALIQRRMSTANSSELTEREREILKELVDGATNKEIGEKLFISVRTVDAHRRNIMKKLNVKNGVQLVRVSLERNLV
ncbi:MAG: response regulator transcription factor [Ekhidna sp.]